MFQKWDRCLCETDSDGDGKTNGEELGDPACNWKPGPVPQRNTGLSHPGICEPFDDPVCIGNNEKFGNFCEKEAESECLSDIRSEGKLLIIIQFPENKL